MYSGPGFLMQLLESFAYQTPYFLLYFIGIICAVFKLKRSRTPAILVIASLSILIVISIVHTVSVTYLRNEVNQSVAGHYLAKYVYGAGICFSILKSLALALLIYAVFVGRNPAPRSDE